MEKRDEWGKYKEENEGKVKLSRGFRLFIFVVLISITILVSGDNGIVSSSSNQIKLELHFTNTEYGTFGGCSSIGKLIGGVIFMALLTADNRKLLTCCTIAIQASCFFMYLFTKNKIILLIVRLIIGIVKCYPTIYIPLWVDQFGIRNLRTIKMCIVNLALPIGQIFGYSIGTFNPPEKWSLSFALLGTSLWILGLIIFMSPSKYFSKRYSFIGYKDGDRFVSSINERTENSVFGSENKEEKKKMHGSMLEILKSGTYIFSAFTRANLLFIFQVIHLFITEYVTNGLKVNKQTDILKYYGASTILGPFLGGSLGGLISTKLGGYDNRKSVFVCVGCGTLTLISIIPLAFSKQFMIFSLSLFSFFFCSSALLPTIIGYIISSVPKEHKGAGSSMNLLISSLMGSLPGPIVYGYIHDKVKERSQTFAWKCVMLYYLFGYSSCLLASVFRYRQLSKAEDNEYELRETSNDESWSEPYEGH